MKTKRVLSPERLRQVPRQFSWIDQRLVRDGHIDGCSPQALALYLFLVTVADAQGFARRIKSPAFPLLKRSRPFAGPGQKRSIAPRSKISFRLRPSSRDKPT